MTIAQAYNEAVTNPEGRSRVDCIPCGVSYLGAHDGDRCLRCGEVMNPEAAVLAIAASRIDGAAWIMLTNDVRRSP